MDTIKITKVTKFFVGEQEVITYKEVARTYGLSSTTALALLHHDKSAEGRPTPFVVGTQNKRYFVKSEVDKWIAPLVEASKERTSRGIGRPRKS
jgi:predicted DNA-binding transcriptional regulator AlpA